MNGTPLATDEIPDSFIEIIARYSRRKGVRPIYPNHSILHDLRIFGDDADEMCLEIEREFNVRFRENELEKFIPGEGSVLRFFLVESLLLNFRSYQRFTVYDLWKIVKYKMDLLNNILLK